MDDDELNGLLNWLANGESSSESDQSQWDTTSTFWVITPCEVVVDGSEESEVVEAVVADTDRVPDTLRGMVEDG